MSAADDRLAGGAVRGSPSTCVFAVPAEREAHGHFGASSVSAGTAFDSIGQASMMVLVDRRRR